MKRQIGLVFSILLLIVAFEVSGLAQCAMCVTALQNSAEGKVLAQSFGHGILFLLAVPYVIFGAASYTVYRAYRKNKIGN